MPTAPIHRPISLLLAVVALLLLAACGGRETAEGGNAPSDGDADAGGGGAAASCVAAVRYEGSLYISVGSRDLERGRALVGAEVPACNDTGDVATAPAQPIDAFAIAEVDPRYAVTAGEGPAAMVYVREGYVPGMRDAQPLPPDVAEALGL